MEDPDFDKIKFNYEQAYMKCIDLHKTHISDFIEDWPSVLNKIQTIIYNEIKSSGVRLYPLYPVGSDFINFGNPFKKIGIEILYKTNGLKEKKVKLESLKSNGWTVHTFESKFVSYTLDRVLENEKYSGSNFEELDPEDKLDLIEKYKEINLECLMYCIMDKLSEDSYSVL